MMKMLLPLFLISFLGTNADARLLYSNDASGKRTFGSKQALFDAALSGKEISVGMHYAGYKVYKAHVAQVFSNNQLCLYTQAFSTNMVSWDRYKAHDTPYVLSICTSGESFWRKRYSNGAVHSGENAYRMDWFIPDTTEVTEIYRNDYRGQALQGARGDLIGAVKEGKRVAVRLDYYNAVYHGEIPQVYNNDVCMMIYLYAYNRGYGDAYDALNFPTAKNLCSNGNERVRSSILGTFYNRNVGNMTWFVVE